VRAVLQLRPAMTASDALTGWIFEGEAGRQGHFFLAVDPAAFGDPDTFRRGVSAYLDEIRRSRKAPGVDAIRIPGERAFAERERRLKEGVTVLEATWTIVAGLARELGVAVPA